MMATAMATHRPTTADRLTSGDLDLDWLVNAIMVAQQFKPTASAALDDFCTLFFRCEYRALIAAYRLYRPYVERQAESGLEAMRQQMWCTAMPKALLTQTIALGSGLAEDVAIARLSLLLGELSASQGHRVAVVLARNGLHCVG